MNTLEKLNYQLQIGAISQKVVTQRNTRKQVDLFDKETADSPLTRNMVR